MTDLQAVALGEATADLVVRGGHVFLPERGEFQRLDVAVSDGVVATLTDDASTVTGSETHVIDATDQHVLPGFIDAHTHVDLHQSLEGAVHRILEGGTTGLIAECPGISLVLGADGVTTLLDRTATLPIDVRFTVPPQLFFDTFEPQPGRPEDHETLRALLDHPRIVGVGETDWIHAVGNETPATALYDRAAAVGKPVTGHAAGCRDENLSAFATLIDNDHEAITGEEVIERVTRGIHTVGRYGTIRDDIGAIAEAAEQVPTRELSLSSDGMWPRDLVSEGYMDVVVQRAIEAGIDPIDAFRMATLNPARHFGLNDRGSLSPGSVADILVLDELETVSVDTVVADGDVVVRGGDALVEPMQPDYPDSFRETATVSREPDRYRVPSDAVSGDAVRAVEYVSGLLTRETREPVVERDGELVADPDAGLLKATLVERRPHGDGASFTGFVTGLGPLRGAVATSMLWEYPGHLVVGSTAAAMQRALDRVIDMDGGWAAVADGNVVADVPLPLAGRCADMPVEETAAAYETLESALRDIGMDVERPLLAIQTLTTPGVPRLRFTASGYADIRNQRTVTLDPN